MCRFDYKKFRFCDHDGIEARDFCDEALWKAGRYGELQICTPEIFTRSLEWQGEEDHEPPRRTVFVGYEGFCTMCTIAYQLPRTKLERNHSDLDLDYSKAHNVFDPDETGPYFLSQGFVARVPDLLGLSDQTELVGQDHGPQICFPPIVEQTSWSELRKSMPFTSKGKFEQHYVAQHNDSSVDKLLLDLDIIGGLTTRDVCFISHTMIEGSSLRTLYNTMFKPRGMPYGNFDTVVQNLRASAPNNAVEEAQAGPASPRALPEVSDISTLSDLTSTPELSTPGVSMQPTPLHLSPQSLKATGNGSVQDEQTVGVMRNGNQAKASMLARTAIAACSPREGDLSKQKAIPATSVPSATSADKDVPAQQRDPIDVSDVSLESESHYSSSNHGSVGDMPGRTNSLESSEDGQNTPSSVFEAEQHRMTPELDSKKKCRLPKQKPAFRISGKGSSVPPRRTKPSDRTQLMLGQVSLSAEVQGPGREGLRSTMTRNDMSNMPIEASMGVGAHTEGSPTANSKTSSKTGNTASDAPLPYVDRSFPQNQEVHRYLENLNFKANQGFLPHGRHDFVQGVRQEVLDVVVRPPTSEDPSSSREQDGTPSQQSHDNQQSSATHSRLGTQQAFGVPQQHGMNHQASALPSVFPKQRAVPIRQEPKKIQRILTVRKDDVRAWVESNGAHPYARFPAAWPRPAVPTADGPQRLAHGLPQNPQMSAQNLQPALPKAGGPQRLAHGLPQNPQTPARNLQPAVPTVARPQRLANGLPQLLPAAPYQVKPSTQHPQGFQLRLAPQQHATAQPLASSQEASQTADAPVDEDDEDGGLQETSSGAWAEALAARKRKAA